MTQLELSKLRSVAVQSSPMHRVHLLRSSSRPSVHPRARFCPRPRRLPHQWRANVWLVLTLSCLYWLTSYEADAVATTVETEPKSTSDTLLARSTDLYIVLVSIPVLDKMRPLKHLAESLLARGVRVGFALPEQCRQFVNDLEGLEFLSLGPIDSRDDALASDRTELERLGVYGSYVDTLRYYASFQRPMYDKVVAHLQSDRPDLVVVDRYTFAGFDACHHLDLPYVVNSPSMLWEIDSPPSYIPAPFSNYTMHTLSVLERCLNLYYRLRFRLGLVKVFQDINTVRQDIGLEPIKSKQQLHGQALVLVNSIFGLDEARDLMPQFRMVGLLRSQQLQLERAQVETSGSGYRRFSSSFTSWFDTPEHQLKPLIYMSLTPLVTADEINLIIHALEKLHIRLLWKTTLEVPETVAPFPNWVFHLHPEEDDAVVLTLVPEIALFVMSGDYQLILEALVAGAPLLGLPHSAEQLEGMNAVVRAGAGSLLDWTAVTEHSLRRAVDEIVFEETDYFKTNAVYLGELIKTGGGIDRAVDELLTVAQVGSSHVLPMHTRQPLYKTYLVDVYLIYGVILCGAAIILRTFLALVLSLFQPLTPFEMLGATRWSK